MEYEREQLVIYALNKLSFLINKIRNEDDKNKYLIELYMIEDCLRDYLNLID